MTKYPFEVTFDEILSDIDEFVSTIFASLESEFLTLPKGEGFIDYHVFETGYETLLTFPYLPQGYHLYGVALEGS